MSIRGGAVLEWGSREELGRSWAVPWSHGAGLGELRGGARRGLSITEAGRGGLGGGARRGRGRSWAPELGMREVENLGARYRDGFGAWRTQGRAPGLGAEVTGAECGQR